MENETQENTIKRFNTQLELEVLKVLSKILPTKVTPISEEMALKRDDLGVMDAGNVCMIIAKSEEAKRVLFKFVDSDIPIQKIPLFFDKPDILSSRSNFSIAYLKSLMKLFICFENEKIARDYNSGSLWLQMGHDYPLVMENDHFKIILAPRVENND